MTTITLALALLLASVFPSNCFSPVSRQPCKPLSFAATTSALHSSPTKGEEKAVRQKLQKKGTKITKEAEGKYGLLDGANMKGAFQTANATSAVPTQLTEHSNSMEAKIERMIKPRAYPLFLAEKVTEIGEGIVGKVFKGTKSVATKEKVVVLGTGWGAAAFLKDIDTDLYDVTIISPRNYFLFTPMLAGASVGSVEYRSITEPVRELNSKATFLEAVATEIDPKTKTVSCESVACEGNSCEIDAFDVNYDRLLVTIGAQTNTFGIPGVREHCCFLKQVEDARRIRTAIVNCFERANLPNLSVEEKENTLTFAVIGAGPTGVEFAAELRDFIEEDGPKYYPDLLKHVSIRVIEAAGSVLAPFDKALQEEAVRQMKRTVSLKDSENHDLLPPNFELTHVCLGCSVKEITDDTIFLNDGRETKYGLAVWAAGNGPLPLTLGLIESLGEEQKEAQDVARGRLAVDPWLRCVGGEGQIFALGDCSCITKGQLPATAQVAAQQAEFVAGMMNKEYILSPPLSEEGTLPPPMKNPAHGRSLSESISSFAIGDGEYAKPFQFWNLGILAYTGAGSALAQMAVVPDKDPIKGTGAIGNAIWKSVYLTKQVSWRNRLLVLNDWTKRKLFGRDITRL